MSRDWAEAPFMDYLEAVDNLLEDGGHAMTVQAELTEVAAAQEAGFGPEECVEDILTLRGE